MKNRSLRIQMIRQIISSQVISSQDELLLKLEEQGCEVTQATLSRDLKQIQVMKVSDAKKGYIYRLSDENSSYLTMVGNHAREDFMSEGIVSIEYSSNILVIKTLPGYANSVAILIDKVNPKEILGTVAGDDTIFLVIREGVERGKVRDALKVIMPKIDTKF